VRTEFCGVQDSVLLLSPLKLYFIIHKNVNRVSIDILLEIMHAIGIDIRIAAASDSFFDINIGAKGYWYFDTY